MDREVQNEQEILDLIEEADKKAAEEAAAKAAKSAKKDPGAKEPKAAKEVSDATKEAKKKAIQAAIANIEKQYGKNTVMRLGERTDMQVSTISTGSLSLDIALGIGGIPRGRIIELYGPESSGKTTLALHMIAEAQKGGGEAAFIDAEHALDPTYAAALGVDIDELLISQPDSGEQALEIAEALARSSAIDLIVIDSVAALVPKMEIDGMMGESFVGLHARLMSQALRKLTSVVSKGNCSIVFINQLREKVGVMYGNPEVTTGGRALKFYSSVRIEIRRSDYIKQGSENIGNYTRAKVVKNKMAPPFREAYFDIMFGEGISRISEIVELGETVGLVSKSGSWYSIGEERVGQGKESAKQYLRDHPDVAADLEAQIRDLAKNDPGIFSGKSKKTVAKAVPAKGKTSSAKPVDVEVDGDGEDED